jgi:PST family polysaccharide transporter
LSILFFPSEVIDLWFQSISKSKISVIAKNSSILLSSLSRIAAIHFDATITTFAIIIAIEAAITAAFLILAYRQTPTAGRLQFNSKIAISILTESFPYLISGLSVIIYMRIDHFFIVKFLSKEELGIYSAMLPMASIWTSIPLILNASIAPIISRAKSNNTKEYEKIIGIIFRSYLLLSITSCLVTFFISNSLTLFLYGTEYADCASLLRIYVLTNIGIYLGLAQQIWMTQESLGHLSMIKALIGALSATVFGFILIPKFGLVGACISAVLCQLISGVLVNVIFCRNVFFAQIGFPYRP